MTYTPQTRDQMVACGDLGPADEYFSPVLFDFLLFVSEGFSVIRPMLRFRLAMTIWRLLPHASGERVFSMSI